MKKAIIGSLMFVMAALPSTGFADGWVEGTIESISIRDTGNIIITTTTHVNPDSCAKNNRVIIDNTHAGKKEILAVTLSAKLTNKVVKYFVSGCEAERSIPQGTMAKLQ